VCFLLRGVRYVVFATWFLLRGFCYLVFATWFSIRDCTDVCVPRRGHTRHGLCKSGLGAADRALLRYTYNIAFRDLSKKGCAARGAAVSQL
jgi:hypothetical protein